MASKTTTFLSWNLNGIRSCASKGLADSVSKFDPDIIAFQETKAATEIVQKLCSELFPNYELYCSSAIKPGYSGVATLVKKGLQFTTHSTTIPDSLYTKEQNELVNLFEKEGRFSILRSKDLTFINVYVPSGTSGPERQALKMKFLDLFSVFLEAELKQQKNILVCGDVNICHQEIDIHHPKEATKRQLTGFLPEERAWVSSILESTFIDCYRHINPLTTDIYSWWSYRAAARAKNLGWRIDYFFCSRSLCPMINDVSIHSSVMGSDHCPITLNMKGDICSALV